MYRALALLLIAFVCSPLVSCKQAQAQNYYDGMDITASAIMAFNASNDHCDYAPVVKDAFNRMNDYWTDVDSWAWQDSLRIASKTAPMTNLVFGITNDGMPVPCSVSAITVRQGLIFALPLYGTNIALMAEITRLTNLRDEKQARANEFENARNAQEMGRLLGLQPFDGSAAYIGSVDQSGEYPVDGPISDYPE